MLSRLLVALSPNPLLPRLASQCAVCRCWPAETVCAPCTARFTPVQPRCRTCALPLPPDLSNGLATPADRCIACLRNAPPLDAAFAAVSYGYPWSSLVAGYKFGDQPGHSRTLARLTLAAPGVQAAFDRLCADDWILPLPLSLERLKTRGFNQAWQMGKALAKASASAGRLESRLLLRTRDTPPQSRLSRDERLRNVEGAFVVEPLRAQAVEGRKIVLVDDVMTSGASVFAAAKALRQAGAAHIAVVVFARTE